MRAWRFRVIAVALALAAAGAAVGVGPGSAAPRATSGCDRPLTYDVVRLDPAHHVSRAAFVALLRRSERVWEVPAGRDLLRYQPGGSVHVSLIFDERQVLASRIAAADASIGRMRADLAKRKADVRARSTRLAARKARLAQRIDYWNARGGAPHDIFLQLEAEQKAVNAQVDADNAVVRSYNAAVSAFNAAVAARNALVRRRGTGEHTLGKAQLGGTEVSIFVLSGTARDEELVAHEFGHILGARHVAGVGNVMNPVLVRLLDRASAADLAALSRACAAR